MSLYLSGLMKPQRSSVPTTLVHVAPSARAVQSASLPTAARLCRGVGTELTCQGRSVGLPGMPCQAFLNVLSLEHFWLVCPPLSAPSISHCPRALPLAWTPASASSRQARSSLPDVSSLENQTIKGIAQRDKGRLFPQAWFLSGCWLHCQCLPA